jgi:hypothetical protein
MMQMGVGQLEELFAKSKADQRVLKQLEHELGFRQVQRAMTLLGQVQTALKASMSGLSPAAAPAPAEQVQPPPTVNPPPTAVSAAPRAAVQVSLPFPTAAVSPAVPLPVARPVPVVPAVPVASRPAAPPAPATATPLLQISLEDACRILKVLPGDTWEQIEQSRRKLVMRSHPEKLAGLGPAQALQARAEAMRVNDAYLVVAGRRSGQQ